MGKLHPLCVVVSALGIALGLLLSSDFREASAQGPKAAPKTKAPKAAPKAKAPKAVKPTVQKKVASNVKPAVKKLPEPQKKSNAQLAKALEILHSVSRTLAAANHDYGGHKGDAMKLIGQASKNLDQALASQGGKSHVGSAPRPAGGGGKSESQVLSNAQLKSQIPLLQRTIGMLEKADHDYGGHRQQAVSQLKATVAQLEKALKHAK